MNKIKLNAVFVFLVITAIVFGFSQNSYGLSADSLKPSGWVNDYAGVIDADSFQQLTSLIGELQEKTGAEIAVVTIKSLEGQSLEDFTNKLFAKWGVGKKGKDNGLMILVAIDERKIRIETGYGLEGVIPDGTAGSIIRDNMTPEFRAGNPGRAILAGTNAAANLIAASYNVQLTGDYYQSNPVSSHKATAFEKVLSAIFMIVMLIIFIKNPWLFVLIMLGGRGGRSSGGFGGGFGGFGGGSSGGGGASGGW